jgi:preprotein translocase subunit SecG
VALGALVGSFGLLASFFAPSDRLLVVAVSVSFIALTVGLGAALAWQAWQAIQGRGSQPYQPRLVGIWILLFLLVVIAGQAALRSDLMPSLIFPPLHVLAAALPPSVIIALAARSLGDISCRRDIVIQLSSGALVATVLAFTLEFIAIVAISLAILAVVLVQPNGLEQIGALLDRLQDPTWLEDPGQLSNLTRSPLLLSVAFLVFAVVVPLIEEAIKTIGVPLRAYRQPGLAQAFLWGLVSGAGFALAEALFNGLGDLNTWAGIISLRVGATLLHCFTGALMGLAWYFALLEGRWRRGLGLYAASVGTHGLWNALVAGMVAISLSTQNGTRPYPAQVAGGLGAGAIFVLLVLLALAMAAGLLGLTRYVRARAAKMERARALATSGAAEAFPEDTTVERP